MIENAGLLVAKSSGQKIEPHGPEADVWQRDDDTSAFFEQIEIAAQDADGPGQMFEDVGEDDDVEAAAAERDAGNIRALGFEAVSVTLDDGPRGGKIVIFNVREKPPAPAQ